MEPELIRISSKEITMALTVSCRISIIGISLRSATHNISIIDFAKPVNGSNELKGQGVGATYAASVAADKSTA